MSVPIPRTKETREGKFHLHYNEDEMDPTHYIAKNGCTFWVQPFF